MRTCTALFALVFLCLAGCVAVVDPDVDLPDVDLTGATNMPVVGNASNSFGFALIADDAGIDEAYGLSFTADELSIGIAVASYRGGSGSFELVGEDGEVFYRRNLGTNIAEGTTLLSGNRPVRAVVRLDDYSGVVTVGVSLQE